MACHSCGSNTTGDNCGCCGPTVTFPCETLPSQITNFTQQFFGDIVKTEVDGHVVWSLPCQLDVGLPQNPRGEGEGLACYFLRLFKDGIIGLQGEKGDTGEAGTDGHNAYTVTLQSFTQPTLAAPLLQVRTVTVPGMIAGLYVFIQDSGWYQINNTDDNGTLFLTMVRASEGVSGTVVAGKLVVPSGSPGASFTGPTGPPGPIGPAGAAGTAYTTTNGFYYGTTGVNFPIPLVSVAVTFVNNSPNFIAPVAGTYLVNVVAGVAGSTGVAQGDKVTLKLTNTSISGDVVGSFKEIQNLVDGCVTPVPISALVTTSAANQTIALFAGMTNPNTATVNYSTTSIAWVRVA